ncbi:7941_t:CDS:2, partial [Scutellospora calospora]
RKRCKLGLGRSRKEIRKAKTEREPHCSQVSVHVSGDAEADFPGRAEVDDTHGKTEEGCPTMHCWCEKVLVGPGPWLGLGRRHACGKKEKKEGERGDSIEAFKLSCSIEADGRSQEWRAVTCFAQETTVLATSLRLRARATQTPDTTQASKVHIDTIHPHTPISLRLTPPSPTNNMAPLRRPAIRRRPRIPSPHNLPLGPTLHPHILHIAPKQPDSPPRHAARNRPRARARAKPPAGNRRQLQRNRRRPEARFGLGGPGPQPEVHAGQAQPGVPRELDREGEAASASAQAAGRFPGDADHRARVGDPQHRAVGRRAERAVQRRGAYGARAGPDARYHFGQCDADARRHEECGPAAADGQPASEEC